MSSFTTASITDPYTDTEANSISSLLLLARSATHAVGVTLLCSLSTARSGTYCLIKYRWYVIPSGFEVKGFPHPPLRGPPSLLGKADGYRSSLICGMGFNFQLSILSFQFYPCRRHTFPSALGPGPSSLCSLTTDDCSLTTVYCGQRPPLSLTHKAKSPPKAEYENVKGEKPWKLFGRNGPLL